MISSKNSQIELQGLKSADSIALEYEQNQLNSFIYKKMHQTTFLLEMIPFVIKLAVPLVLLSINFLQLNKITVINSYAFAMDPYFITDTNPSQWWRLFTYILVIDGSDSGIRDFIVNIFILIALGLISAILLKEKLQNHVNQTKQKTKIHQNGFQTETKTTEQSQKSIAQISSPATSGQDFSWYLVQNNRLNLQEGSIVDQNILIHNYSLSKYWAILIFVEIPLVSLTLAVINTAIWYIITRNAAHSFISMGLVPIFYYFVMRASFIKRKQYEFQLWLVNFSMKSQYQGYLVGLILLIFSNQAQTCLIIMIGFIILGLFTK